MAPKKILILYTSSGLGHKSIAENMGLRLSQSGYEVRLADGYNLQPSKHLDSYNKLHLWVYTHAPFIWRWLYDWGYFWALPLRVFTAGFNSANIKKLINDFKPDLVISTQVSVSAVVAFLKRSGDYKNLFAISFSDYHLHRMWLYKQADFYLVNIPEQAKRMQQLGIPADKIFNCGITLKPKQDINLDLIRQKLGIAQGQKVVLVSAGSLGLGLPEKLIDKLVEQAALPDPRKIIIVCGKNTALKERLSEKYEGRAAVFGFYAPMDELYAISDIFVTKPGGLSVAESLQWRLPMLITHFLPGQEEKNVGYLIGKKWIMNESVQSLHNNVSQTLSIINKELTTGSFKKSLSQNSSIADLLEPKGEAQGVVGAAEAMFHSQN